MCLDRLKEFKTTGTGWKAVTKGKNHYAPPIRCVCTPYKTRQWNKDPHSHSIGARQFNYPDGRNKDFFYPTGYHIFTKKEDAKKWGKDAWFPNIIKKVKYRKVVATGYQSNMRVVVAREFKFVD